MKKNKDIFEYLDDEERELIESINEDDLVELSAAEKKKRRKEAQAAATNFFRKDKKINLRLNAHDYENIRMSAARQGLPYQTLISSLITQYVNGQLIPRRYTNLDSHA